MFGIIFTENFVPTLDNWKFKNLEIFMFFIVLKCFVERCVVLIFVNVQTDSIEKVEENLDFFK